jgi:hypothetical protein
MPKPVIKRHSRPSEARADPRGSLRDVTVDDVLRDLLDLFRHLGFDAGRLAARVADVDSAYGASPRLYPHAYAIGDLLTAWHQDPDYLDEFGSPLPIKLRSRGRSFRHLADKTVPNVDPGALLAKLEKVGAVSIDPSGNIRVHMRSLPVYEDKDLAIQHTLISLDSFIRTLRHNLDRSPTNPDQLFHRVAWHGNFDPRAIPALKIRVQKQGQNFLESCDNWMTRGRKSLARVAKKKRVQVFIGVYLGVDAIE